MRQRVFRVVALLVSGLCVGQSARTQESRPPSVTLPSPAALGIDPEQQRAAPGEPELVTPKTEISVSPNTGVPTLEVPRETRTYSLVEMALMSGETIDHRYAANSRCPDDLGIWERTRDGYGDQIHRLVSDAKRFYCCSDNLLYIGLAIAVAAPIANTRADHEIREWYQRQAGVGRSESADEFANGFKYVGNWYYAVPFYLTLSLGGHLFPDHALMSPIGQFGDRSLRALAIGAPTVGILQVGLGGDRPDAGTSYWHPFRNSHGASGHAFVGAVPFLTAASMVENRALKAVLIAGSFATGWSRIHEDRHYFSQVLLGWTIACLSVESVNWTENQAAARFRIVPFDVPKGVGMGLHIEY